MKIIADAATTGTEWRIWVPGGEVLIRKTSGLNFAVSRDERNHQILAENLRTELELPDGEESEMWFYGAGLVSREICEEWEVALGVAFQCGSVHAASDMVGAARAVLGEEAGIASILGTGSIAAAFSDILHERVGAAGYGISAIVPSPAEALCRSI